MGRRHPRGAARPSPTAAAITYKHVDGLATADAMESGLRDIIASEQPDADRRRRLRRRGRRAPRWRPSNPDTAFAFGSGGEEQAPNFSVFDNWLQDPAYLAGMLAGGLTKTDVIGVVGAMPIPEVNRIVNAFVDGARRRPTPTPPSRCRSSTRFFDPATAKQAAEAQVSPAAPTCCSPSATA